MFLTGSGILTPVKARIARERRAKKNTGASYNGSTSVSKTASVGSIPPAPANILIA